MHQRVLDHGFVGLVVCMGNDLTVVNAARVSYNGRSESLTDKDIKLIDYLAQNNHTSPFRHVYFQFHCKVPEFVARQWYKHVVGIAYSSTNVCNDHGWNEISGRYVESDSYDFYCPDNLRRDSKTNKQASETADSIPPEAIRLVEDANSAALHRYKALREYGVAKEQARMVLPLTFYTEFYWTISLQALAHFIALRDSPHAQYEIQEYAKALYTLAEPHTPFSLKALLKRAK